MDLTICSDNDRGRDRINSSFGERQVDTNFRVAELRAVEVRLHLSILP